MHGCHWCNGCLCAIRVESPLPSHFCHTTAADHQAARPPTDSRRHLSSLPWRMSSVRAGFFTFHQSPCTSSEAKRIRPRRSDLRMMSCVSVMASQTMTAMHQPATNSRRRYEPCLPAACRGPNRNSSASSWKPCCRLPEPSGAIAQNLKRHYPLIPSAGLRAMENRQVNAMLQPPRLAETNLKKQGPSPITDCSAGDHAGRLSLWFHS